MTRQYEVVYIFDSALEETAINERLARFHALIQQPADSGKVVLAHAGHGRRAAQADGAHRV